jgi:hypothetical protein
VARQDQEVPDSDRPVLVEIGLAAIRSWFMGDFFDAQLLFRD